MNGNKSDAIYFIALDGFLMNVVVPSLNESIDVGYIVNQIIANLIIECTHICTFIYQILKSENRVEPLNQIEHRQAQ